MNLPVEIGREFFLSRRGRFASDERDPISIQDHYDILVLNIWNGIGQTEAFERGPANSA